MAEKRHDQYIEWFDKCAAWLDQQKWVRMSLTWLQAHMAITLASIGFLGLVTLLTLSNYLFGGKKNLLPLPTEVLVKWEEKWRDFDQKWAAQLVKTKEVEAELTSLRQKLEALTLELRLSQKELALTKLPRPAILTPVAAVIASPVSLKIVRPETALAQSKLVLYVEQLVKETFVFVKESADAALTLTDGTYRVRAYLSQNDTQGPYSDSVIFRVDNTPPQGTLTIEKQDQSLIWKIETMEERVQIATTIEWESGFLALKTPGKEGNCQLPANCSQATVRVILKDEAGNEASLSQVWSSKPQK